MAYRDEVLADNPVGYWRLGETSGTLANDETANHLNGTYQNSPTLGVVGAVGEGNTAVSFNGINQYASVPDNNLLDLGDVFTVEAWIKTTQTTSGYIVNKGNNYSIYIWNGKIELAAGNTRIKNTTITVNDGNWHHLVATKPGPSAAIYIDGVNRTANLFAAAGINGTDPLFIATTNGTNLMFDGVVDEVAIYPTALSQTRVQAHYEIGFNQVPYIPSNLSPANNEGDINGMLLCSVSDPKGDTITSVTIELYDETAAAYVAGYTDVSPQVVTTDLEDGVMTHDASAALVVGHSYRWRAKASDGTLTSAFSSWAYFSYGLPPVVTLTEPDPDEVITEPGLPITFTYSHPTGLAKIADRVLIRKQVGSGMSQVYDSGWVGTQGSPEPRTSITLPAGTLRNQEHYDIKVMVRASGGFGAETAYVPFDVLYTGPPELAVTGTADPARAEVALTWTSTGLGPMVFGGYEIAVGAPTGDIATAEKTIVHLETNPATTEYVYPLPVSGESKGYYVRQIENIAPDQVESEWTRVAVSVDFGDRIFVKNLSDPYNLLFDFEPLRQNLPSRALEASQEFLKVWGQASPVELLGEGKEATGDLEIPFYDDPLFAQSAAERFAMLEEIERQRGTVVLLLSLPTRRKEFVAIEGGVEMGSDDLLKPTASFNWRRVDHTEDVYAGG